MGKRRRFHWLIKCGVCKLASIHCCGRRCSTLSRPLKRFPPFSQVWCMHPAYNMMAKMWTADVLKMSRSANYFLGAPIKIDML